MEHYTVQQLSAAFSARDISPVEYAKKTIANLENDAFNCINAFDAQRILKRAEESEGRYLKKEPLSPLDGIPVGVKDIIDTKGLETTYGSRAYLGHVPEKSAFVISALEAAGAITDIKTNTCEFALGATGEDSLNGAVENPARPGYYSGGSSSGSAAAVRAGYLPAAIGTDSGGSIRTPSSLCGLVGMKTTYSLISTEGIMPLSETIDTVGPITTTIRDNALVLNALARYNPCDWRQSPPPQKDYTRLLGGASGTLRVAVLRDLFEGVIHPDVASAGLETLERMAQGGIECKEVQAGDLSRYRNAHQQNMCAYGHGVHAHDLAAHGDVLYPRVIRRLEAGNISTDQYVAYEQLRREFSRKLLELIGDYDCLCLPATPVPAAKIGESEREVQLGGVSVTYNQMTASYNWMASYAGLPSLAIPVGVTRERLPVGLALIGRFYSEDVLYALGEQILSLC